MRANTDCYTRVSPVDQNLQRQILSTAEYAGQHFDVQLNELEYYRDKTTGANTGRSSYRKMMNAVGTGSHRIVVVREISRITRSLANLKHTVSRVTDADGQIHFILQILSFGDGTDSPIHKHQLQMSGTFADWEAEVKGQNTVEGIVARRKDMKYQLRSPSTRMELDKSRLTTDGALERIELPEL